jgi:hypothetical protein
VASRKGRGTHGTAKKRAGAKPRSGASSFALVPARLGLEHPEPDKQKAIAAFLKTGTVAGACQGALIGRSTWYRWVQEDLQFARMVAEAQEHVTDSLEELATTRARAGSDTLLIFLLKARRRSVYADKDVVTTLHAEVQLRLQQQAQLIAQQETWDAEELLQRLDLIWK